MVNCPFVPVNGSPTLKSNSYRASLVQTIISESSWFETAFWTSSKKSTVSVSDATHSFGEYTPAPFTMWSVVLTVISRATWVDWLFLVGVLLGVLYYCGTSTYDYFERVHKLPSLRPKMPWVGNFLPMLTGTEPLPDLIKRLYDEGAGHRVVGVFDIRTPMFMIRDPELLKFIAVKDFDHFVNHRKAVIDDIDPVVLKNLFSLRDQRWREMRATLSPAFTTSKLRGMFGLIATCARQLADHVGQEHAKAGKEILELDVKELFTRFTNDVIATTAFGISVDSLKNPENEFYTMGKKATTPSIWQILVVVGFLTFPKLTKALGGRLISKKLLTFFDSLVHETIKERKRKDIFRPDMLQLLMQAREGQLKNDADDDQHEESKTTKKNLDDDDVTAQALIFFFAGFETVSLALSFTTYALATHPNVQKCLQNEVDEVMQKTNGELTYEVVQGMKYLDMVLNEALRLYPPGIVTDRDCNGTTSLPAGDNQPEVHLQDGDKIWIPISGIHRDPQYWSNPEQFNPDRFNDENKPHIKPFTFMPFGFGPRICIGQRFALLELKLALIYLVSNFELSRKDGNDGSIKYARGMKVMPLSGHKTNFRAREKRKDI